jgi:hypothetical protein
MSEARSRALERFSSFPLLAALTGRRARRFAIGNRIPDGPLAYRSAEEPIPLDEKEQLIVLTAMAGSTGWSFLITRNARYAPQFPNYSCAAGGRSFPSAAAFHTSQLFFTDDSGVYFFDTRDAAAAAPAGSGPDDLDEWLEAHRAKIRCLGKGRMKLPPEEPYMEGHNTWCVNVPGSLLAFPVADVAQHTLAAIAFLLKNGGCLYDDISGEPIRGMERYTHLLDPDKRHPLSYYEQYSLAECAAELSACCFAGVLALQAMGLGGWMFDGLNPFAVLGAEEPGVGLGFEWQRQESWSVPNPTGLAGVFEGFCPPHYPDMRAAVEALAERKFGAGGPFDPATPGPWKESSRVRGAAEVHPEEFKECVALQAQHVYDHFGRFPATVPSTYVLMYLQAHHLDLGFYDRHFAPGAYLETHRRHMQDWHGAD